MSKKKKKKKKIVTKTCHKGVNFGTYEDYKSSYIHGKRLQWNAVSDYSQQNDYH